MNTDTAERTYSLTAEDGTTFEYTTNERHLYDGYLVAKAIHDDRVGNEDINPVIEA